MGDRDLSMGPRKGVTYPIKVQYCGNCSMPIEYCEYYPEYDKCKQWLEKNLPTEFEKVKIGEFFLRSLDIARLSLFMDFRIYFSNKLY